MTELVQNLPFPTRGSISPQVHKTMSKHLFSHVFEEKWVTIVSTCNTCMIMFFKKKSTATYKTTLFMELHCLN